MAVESGLCHLIRNPEDRFSQDIAHIMSGFDNEHTFMYGIADYSFSISTFLQYTVDSYFISNTISNCFILILNFYKINVNSVSFGLSFHCLEVV